jgi:hypothetical protein
MSSMTGSRLLLTDRCRFALVGPVQDDPAVLRAGPEMSGQTHFSHFFEFSLARLTVGE